MWMKKYASVDVKGKSAQSSIPGNLMVRLEMTLHVEMVLLVEQGCRNPCVNLSSLEAFLAVKSRHWFSGAKQYFVFRMCSKPVAEGKRKIFIYSISIEPSIFDFSVEILCKLYNIGSKEDLRGDDDKSDDKNPSRKRQNGKMANS